VAIPYVISAALLDISGTKERADGHFRISLSTDGGSSWKMLWQTQPEHGGPFRVDQLDICPVFDPNTSKKVDMVTPFGRYDYQLKVEMDGVQLDDLELTTIFQHNIFALPMLWPGANRLSVTGAMASGTGLKVTSRWDDNDGKGRSHEQVLAAVPANYVVKTNGRKWQDVRCRSLTIEAMVMADEAAAAKVLPLESVELPGQARPFPTERAIGKQPARQPEFERDAEELELALRQRDRSVIADRIVALGALRDPRGAALLERIVIEDATSPAWHKLLASQALYQSIGAEAVPVLMRLLARDPAIVWAKPEGRWSADAMWLHVVATAAALLAEVEDFPERSMAAELIAAILTGERTQQPLAQMYRGEDIGWGLLRALGRLGDRRQVPLLKRFLADKSDAAAVACEALIRIGDPVVLQDLIELLHEAQYSPVRTAAIKGIGRFGGQQHAALLYPFLRHRDEDFRAAAAAALGDIGDPEAIEHIRAALAVESFPWVGEIMQNSLGMW